MAKGADRHQGLNDILEDMVIAGYEDAKKADKAFVGNGAEFVPEEIGMPDVVVAGLNSLNPQPKYDRAVADAERYVNILDVVEQAIVAGNLGAEDVRAVTDNIGEILDEVEQRMEQLNGAIDGEIGRIEDIDRRMECKLLWQKYMSGLQAKVEAFKQVRSAYLLDENPKEDVGKVRAIYEKILLDYQQVNWGNYSDKLLPTFKNMAVHLRALWEANGRLKDRIKIHRIHGYQEKQLLSLEEYVVGILEGHESLDGEMINLPVVPAELQLENKNEFETLPEEETFRNVLELPEEIEFKPFVPEDRREAGKELAHFFAAEVEGEEAVEEVKEPTPFEKFETKLVEAAGDEDKRDLIGKVVDALDEATDFESWETFVEAFQSKLLSMYGINSDRELAELKENDPSWKLRFVSAAHDLPRKIKKKLIEDAVEGIVEAGIDEMVDYLRGQGVNEFGKGVLGWLKETLHASGAYDEAVSAILSDVVLNVVGSVGYVSLLRMIAQKKKVPGPIEASIIMAKLVKLLLSVKGAATVTSGVVAAATSPEWVPTVSKAFVGESAPEMKPKVVNAAMAGAPKVRPAVRKAVKPEVKEIFTLNGSGDVLKQARDYFQSLSEKLSPVDKARFQNEVLKKLKDGIDQAVVDGKVEQRTDAAGDTIIRVPLGSGASSRSLIKLKIEPDGSVEILDSLFKKRLGEMRDQLKAGE